jgi:hypothetical protein
MRKLLKITGILLVVIVILVLGFVSFIEIRGIPSYPQLVKDPGISVPHDSAMIVNGERLASMLCAECHLNQQDHLLTGAPMPDAGAFGDIYSANITQDKQYGIGGWTDGQLLYFLRTGVKPGGQFAPPYMPKFVHMSDYDLESVVAWLRSDDARLKASNQPSTPPKPDFLGKFLCFVAFKPVPYPDHTIHAPDSNDLVAYGKYIVTGKIECWTCHSASFKTGGNPIPDRQGNIVYSANLTPDPQTGIGSWTEDQFAKALKYGIRPDGTTNRYPMVPYTRMTDHECQCIFAYLNSLTPVHNEVKRNVSQ